jgi:hypothetical protein
MKMTDIHTCFDFSMILNTSRVNGNHFYGVFRKLYIGADTTKRSPRPVGDEISIVHLVRYISHHSSFHSGIMRDMRFSTANMNWR